MDSPVPTSQTYIHGDLKYVSNNFIAILEHTDVPEAFHMKQDFLTSSPIGYALTNPDCISANTVHYIWKNSSVGDDRIIVFAHGVDIFHITRNVIVKVLQLPRRKLKCYFILRSNYERFSNPWWIFWRYESNG